MGRRFLKNGQVYLCFRLLPRSKYKPANVSFPESNVFAGIVYNALMRGRRLCSFVCVTLVYLAGMVSKVISSFRSNEVRPALLCL